MPNLKHKVGDWWTQRPMYVFRVAGDWATFLLVEGVRYEIKKWLLYNRRTPLSVVLQGHRSATWNLNTKTTSRSSGGTSQTQMSWESVYQCRNTGSPWPSFSACSVPLYLSSVLLKHSKLDRVSLNVSFASFWLCGWKQGMIEVREMTPFFVTECELLLYTQNEIRKTLLTLCWIFKLRDAAIKVNYVTLIYPLVLMHYESIFN